MINNEVATTTAKDRKNEPQTKVETKQMAEYSIREETTSYPDTKMYLYSNGAVSAYSDRYDWPVKTERSDQKLIEKKKFITDKDGRQVAYFIEADNYHNKPRPAFSTLDSYNPDGTKQAEYGTQYDDAGNLTAENFSTFYPSGNVKTFQTVVHENGERSPILTPSKQKPRTEAESIYIERNDMGGAPIQGQTRIITGTDFLAKTNDTSSLLAQQRQHVMKSMPPIFLEMVKR